VQSLVVLSLFPSRGWIAVMAQVCYPETCHCAFRPWGLTLRARKHVNLASNPHFVTEALLGSHADDVLCIDVVSQNFVLV